MRLHRIAHYADFAVYPVLIAVMILVIADKSTGGETALAVGLASAFALGGAVLWTLLGRVLHRRISWPTSSRPGLVATPLKTSRADANRRLI
jgi:hypothetical protein